MVSSLASGAASGPSSAGESDSEADWEEVVVPAERPHLEITLQTDVKAHNGKGKGKSPKFVAASVSELSKARNLGFNVSRKAGPSESHAQRVLRIECHKVHTLCLLANARVRNGWINDPLLHVCHHLLSPDKDLTSFLWGIQGETRVSDSAASPNGVHANPQVAHPRPSAA
jgi:hypothetical protein